MQLGAFSISLAVKYIQASRDFYEKLGFDDMGGDGRGGKRVQRAKGWRFELCESKWLLELIITVR